MSLRHCGEAQSTLIGSDPWLQRDNGVEWFWDAGGDWSVFTECSRCVQRAGAEWEAGIKEGEEERKDKQTLVERSPGIL